MAKQTVTGNYVFRDFGQDMSGDTETNTGVFGGSYQHVCGSFHGHPGLLIYTLRSSLLLKGTTMAFTDSSQLGGALDTLRMRMCQNNGTPKQWRCSFGLPFKLRRQRYPRKTPMCRVLSSPSLRIHGVFCLKGQVLIEAPCVSIQSDVLASRGPSERFPGGRETGRAFCRGGATPGKLDTAYESTRGFLVNRTLFLVGKLAKLSFHPDWCRLPLGLINSHLCQQNICHAKLSNKNL